MTNAAVIADAAETLRAALSEVDDVRVYTDPGADIRPPAVLLGAPALTWERYDRDCLPSSGTWPVYIVVAADARALASLWDLIPRTTRALDALEPVAVMAANPTTFPVSGADLPAYELTVEVGF